MNEPAVTGGQKGRDERALLTGLDYVTCPDCGREVSLKKNGTMRRHTQPRSSPSEQFPPFCHSSGKLTLNDPGGDTAR